MTFDLQNVSHEQSLMQTRDQTLNPLVRAFAAAGTTEEAAVRARNAYDVIAQDIKEFVVFGGGVLGRFLLTAAQNAGLRVLAIADNDPAKLGTVISGTPVMPPEEAVSRFNNRAVFVVGVFNSAAPRAQLSELRCLRVMPFPVFHWRFSEMFEHAIGLDLPQRVVENANAVKKGYETLSDEKSLREFAAQVQWRCTLDYSCLPAPDDSANIYREPGIVRLTSNEVLVDCGAFDGDSIRMFLSTPNASFSHIYAIEPDPRNRAALEQSLPSSSHDRLLTVFPFAVGDENAVVSFRATGTAASRLAGNGGAPMMECRRIDSLLTGVRPTLIKMDIEGAEPQALAGARETIRRARPILAICAYHQCDHLWRIPALIREIVPDYDIFLRRYAEECWELVYYAVPPERRFV